jgi:hypothetical protein
MYRIDQWVEPAFRQLIATPTTKLSFADAQWIGPQYFYILVQTKAKIDQHRRNVSFSAPDAINDPFCVCAEDCSQAWATEWWRGLAPQLLHPTESASEDQILDAFDTVLVPGMCDACQVMSIEWVKGKDVFRLEDKMLNEAVKEVMAIQTDEAIRMSLRSTVIVPN